MTVQRIAMISVHTSPLAAMGGKKTGGMNVYVRELAQELGLRGIAVDIFTRRSSAAEPTIDEGIGDNVRVIYLNAGPIAPLAPDDVFPHLSQFTARLIAFATLRGTRYDVVYGHYWLSGVVGQKLKEAWGTPFVQMFHTLGQMKERILRPEMVPMMTERIANELRIVQWADVLIAATPAEESQLLWLYRAKARKIRIVPPGVNTERFHPQGISGKRAFPGVDAAQVLLFVGRIEPLKGVDTILRALSIIRSQKPDVGESVILAIVGGNPQQPDADMKSLQGLAEQLQVSEAVVFLGAKDQSELPVYYSAATAVIMPSDYESFGMVALEAMASGTPVIASQVGGLAHVVRDGETGYLVPVRDAQALAERIVQIVTQPGLRDQLGRTAASVAHGYAWGRIADQLIVIFEELDTRRRRNRA